MLLAAVFGLPAWSALAQGDSPTNDEQAIKQVEKEWDDAVVSGNKKEMARLMADGYFNYSDDDQTKGLNKEKFIAFIAALPRPQDTTVRDEIDDIETHMLGDIAVVTARVTPVTTIKGKEQEREFRGRFTHIWQKRDGRWQLVGDEYNPTTPIFKRPTSVKVDPSLYTGYAGTYGDVVVAKTADALTMKIGEDLVQLDPASDSAFFFVFQKREGRATFVRNATGKVTHLFINAGGRAFELEKTK